MLIRISSVFWLDNVCNIPVPVWRYQNEPHEMIGQLHDIVACMHQLSACSDVFQTVAQVRGHRPSMHISNRLHLVLSALQTALLEFRAPHLCRYVRKSQTRHCVLLQICCARRLRHIDLQDARFWLLRFVGSSSILVCILNRPLLDHGWSRSLSIYALGILQTVLGSATPCPLLVHFAATNCQESKLIWHNPLFPGVTLPTLFGTIFVFIPSVCEDRALWNYSMS